MFADGADEVCRQLFAFVLVATDDTAPDGLAGGRCPDRLRLRFDVLQIVHVGSGRCGRKDLHVRYSCDEEGVGAEVDRLGDPAGDEGVRALCHVVDAIVAALIEAAHDFGHGELAAAHGVGAHVRCHDLRYRSRGACFEHAEDGRDAAFSSEKNFQDRYDALFCHEAADKRRHDAPVAKAQGLHDGGDEA